jgi:hypothetical protein
MRGKTGSIDTDYFSSSNSQVDCPDFDNFDQPVQ